MIQRQFAWKAAEVVERDDTLVGLAVGGSWLNDMLDEYSDLDLVLVTKGNVSGNKLQMLEYAKRFGHLLAGFTGEHVGEPRLLICLYAEPLLHVDIKFVTLEEFHARIETPVVLADINGLLKQAILSSDATFPLPDYQWIEDRFWIWIHYALLKIGRGEYFEALDFISYLRSTVLGPLLHLKNGNLPRGVRKVETQLDANDLQELKDTVATYNKQALISALENCITLYKKLRTILFGRNIILQQSAEQNVMVFFKEIKRTA